MAEDKGIPRLLQFIFGEDPHPGPPPTRGRERLQRWCEAFEGWLDERERRYTHTNLIQSKLAWKRLLRLRPKAPWEMLTADIEAHAAWMQTEGYAPRTIAVELAVLTSFYRWCDERRIDPESNSGFNPAAGARRPKIRRYDRAPLLSQGEVKTLLGILERDHSPVGRRDYAFFLARLRTGMPLKKLRELQIANCELPGVEQGAICNMQFAIPPEVADAIRAYLEASGRLEGMRGESYVFAPLADPLRGGKRDQAGDWVEGWPLTNNALLHNLRLYGRAAGIAEEKLTLMALRRTATRLRLEAGDNPEEMQVFLDSKEERKSTKHRLRFLPELPAEEGRNVDKEESEPRVPTRAPVHFKPWEGMTHGFRARSQPAEAVQAVLDENVQGVEEEIVGLRTLERRLMEWMDQAGNSAEAVRLGEAYSMAASRLGAIVEAERRAAERRAKDAQGEASAEEVLTMLWNFAEEIGVTLDREAVMRGALEGTPGLEMGSRKLEVEIAGLRVVLRRTLKLALQAEGVEDAMRLTELYGYECLRLLRLLGQERDVQGRLGAYLKEARDQAIQKVGEEWSRAEQGKSANYANGTNFIKGIGE